MNTDTLQDLLNPLYRLFQYQLVKSAISRRKAISRQQSETRDYHQVAVYLR